MRTKVLVLLVALLSVSCAGDDTHKINNIPEASGVSYCNNSDTLVVANDEGWYYEIDRDGAILHKDRLKKYDLEGVYCEDKRFVFAVEDKGILILNRKTNKQKLIKIDPNYHNKKLKIVDKKRGLEGITKIGDRYYLCKQAKKSKKSFIIGVKLSHSDAKIVDLIRPKIADISGLTYRNRILYMVSDKKDLLVEYDLKKNKIIKKIKLIKIAQEGIAFDGKGFVYISDDDGAVFKYSESELGL